MKKKLLVWTVASLLPIAVMATSVKVEMSGPSGQGDISYVAPATSVTNMAMGTGGLYRVTLDPRYPITGTSLLPGNITLANTYMMIGNASAIGVASTPAEVRTNLNLVIGTDIQAYDADLTTWAGVTPSTDGQALVALANYATMRTNIVGAGTVTASMLDPAIVTNVLADGMTLPAVSGEAITNLAGGNIASGDIAAARIATALGTSGSSIGGNISQACLTNALAVTLYSGTVTNVGLGSTNTLVFVNGVLSSVTLVPAP